MEQVYKDKMRAAIRSVLQSRYDDIDRCMARPGGAVIAMSYFYEACGVIAAAYAAEIITTEEMEALHRELFEQHYNVQEVA